MPKDKFEAMALKLGWSVCKQCKTLVVNVDKDGNCNPPCRRVIKNNPKKIKIIDKLMKRVLNNTYFLINYLNKSKETLVSKNTILGYNSLSKEHKILNASKFIYNEIPIRFSKRIKELEDLPFDIKDGHEIFTLRDWYIKSLHDISLVEEPNCYDSCENFRDIILNILNRHQTTLITISKGLGKLNLSENNKKFNKI